MIRVEASAQQWVVTLDRADKANALTFVMLEELVEIVRKAQEDDALRALIFTGAGARVFSAGADLSEVNIGTPINRSPLWEELSSAISNLPCLTIAALNGTLAGGAFGMALACDLRIATPHTKFFYPVLKNGILPQPSDLARFAEIAGISTAKLVLLGGQKISAEDALRCGLIDKICAPNALMASADALTEAARSTNIVSLVTIKRLFHTPQSEQIKLDAQRAVFDADSDALGRLRELRQ
jgi:enoyl-CoA hydratase/carnithine racemase